MSHLVKLTLRSNERRVADYFALSFLIAGYKASVVHEDADASGSSRARMV